MKKVRLVWHYVAFDKEMESFRTEKQLEELRQIVLSQICEIEAARDFPPYVSNLCRWCLYQDICPMWKHERQLEETPSDERVNDQGVKLVDEYVKIKADMEGQKKAADAKLGTLKEALIHFCREKDIQVVFGTEHKISLREQDSYRFPGKNVAERRELIEFLRESGKLEGVIDLDVHALKKVIDNREWDEDTMTTLERFATKERSITLSVSKK